MGLNARLNRLERGQEPQGRYRLYSRAGDDLTGAEMITVPAADAEGLARLADGTEKAVIMKGSAVVFIFDADDQLWWIQEDGKIFDFVGTGLTEEDI